MKQFSAQSQKKIKNKDSSLVKILVRFARQNFQYLLIAYIGLAVFFLYSQLGRDPLFDWDEAIYAELGQELLRTGKLFTSHWNGGVWFEKPPGLAWISGAGQLLSQDSELGPRFFMPLMSGITLYFVYLIGRKLGGKLAGLLASSVLLSLPLYLDRSRVLNADLPIMLGIVSMVYAVITQRSPLVLALIVSSALWFKGIAGLLVIVLTLPLLLRNKGNLVWSLTKWLVIINLPWHLYQTLLYGNSFWQPYLLEQVIKRATNPIEFHLESRWYYLNFLYRDLGPGILLVAALGLYTLPRAKSLYLAWWIAIPLGLFTLAKTRLFWYILPIYPALSLLVGSALAYSSRLTDKRFPQYFLALGLVLYSLATVINYSDPKRFVPSANAKVELVSSVSMEYDRLLVLVTESERVAEAILPAKERLSSSFRYGGSPSLAYYFGNQVDYYYQPELFNQEFMRASNHIALVAVDDLELVTFKYSIVKQNAGLALIKGVAYAQY